MYWKTAMRKYPKTITTARNQIKAFIIRSAASCWGSRLYCTIWKFWRWGIWGLRVSVGGWKMHCHVPRRILPIHLFRHFCCGMYCCLQPAQHYSVYT